MLRRFREYLRREDEIKAKAKDEVYKGRSVGSPPKRCRSARCGIQRTPTNKTIGYFTGTTKRIVLSQRGRQQYWRPATF